MVEKLQNRQPARSMDSGTADGAPKIIRGKPLTKLSSWGESSSAIGYLFRPSTIEQLKDTLVRARADGLTVGPRGSGNSYGDAILNENAVTVDTQRLNRVLSWDPEVGLIEVEPGVTIARLWQYVLEDGWWPAVVPGTSKPTIAGAAGMNIHGKNAWKAGTIGDHITEFDLMLASGEIVTCNRQRNAELFHAAIGGFGMLGVFVSIKLRLKRIFSGLLRVDAYVSRNLAEMMEQFEQHMDSSDYLVGWIDAFPKGNSLGRGQIHKASYLSEGEDPAPEKTMHLDYQHLPDTLFGVVPRSIMWRFMRPMMNNLGARAVNTGKYLSSRFTNGTQFDQSHVAFHFLLDYVPDWKKAYGRGGLIQYQSFIPKEEAFDAFTEMLRLCQKRGLTNYLSVLKRHKTDSFLVTHGVDGYSLAMDFKVTKKNRKRLLALAHDLNKIVLEASGRFYLAKDSTLTPDAAERYLGSETVQSLVRLKQHYDPETLFQSNMWRRLFTG